MWYDHYWINRSSNLKTLRKLWIPVVKVLIYCLISFILFAQIIDRANAQIQLPLAAMTKSVARADIAQMIRKLNTGDGIAFTCIMSCRKRNTASTALCIATVIVEKSDRFRIDILTLDGKAASIYANGHNLVVYDRCTGEYFDDESDISRLDVAIADVDGEWSLYSGNAEIGTACEKILELPMIYITNQFQLIVSSVAALPGLLETAYDASITWDGRPANLVIEEGRTSLFDLRYTYVIDQITHFPIAVEMRDDDPRGKSDNCVDPSLLDFRLARSPLPASTFRFTPPNGAHRIALN
jgi:outer membrane lipoprotein-sorting protein